MSSGNSNGNATISFGYNSKNVFDYRNKNMCNEWKNDSAKFLFTKCDIIHKPNSNKPIIIKGSVNNIFSAISSINFIKYWAANSPDYRFSFPGSALPFPNEDVAFENSTNSGVLPIKNSAFTFHLAYPNSYYTDLGKTLVKPEVKYQIIDINGKDVSPIYSIDLGNNVPFRYLSFDPKRDWNKGPEFYINKNLKPLNQYQILLNSAYNPNKNEPNNFWGGMPVR